jgi:hypothetical protein
VDARRRRPQIAAGVGIFSDRMPERWIWARVAGDTIDRALLAGALRNKSRSPGRTLIATGAVAGAFAADVYDGLRLEEVLFRNEHRFVTGC